MYYITSGFGFLNVQENIFGRASNIVKSITFVALSYISPKQTIRLEPYSETIREVASKMRLNTAFKLWRVSSIFYRSLSMKEGSEYLNVLSCLTKENHIVEKDRVILESLILRHSKEYLSKFDFCVIFKDDPKTKNLHRTLKDLFALADPCFFGCLKSKLLKLIETDEANPLQESEKLTIHDIVYLAGIDTNINLLLKLKNNLIKGLDEMLSKAAELETLSTHPFFVKLKQVCLESRSPGMIFLGDRHTKEAMIGVEFDSAGTLQQFFMGRICHIGVFVNPEGKGLHLSHVNRITKNHAVMPIRNPLTLPFFYAINLDVSPLLPISLSDEIKQILIIIFQNEFQIQSAESRPNLHLAEFKQHVKMVIMGHKTSFFQKLSQVEYPSKKSSLMCSSYVGITFLKAINKMNKYLEKQGFKERISHPFGEDENIENLDILRLLYLWKQLNIIKPVPLNEKITKVMASTCVFSHI